MQIQVIADGRNCRQVGIEDERGGFGDGVHDEAEVDKHSPRVTGERWRARSGFRSSFGRFQFKKTHFNVLRGGEEIAGLHF
ncbi:MAG TPA: hypothetical protein VGP68_17510 [Gemmataceae bacterium]|nr:hypothetical protein [Gemmataceae bacterium]